ncbi:hypothetical protein [Salinibacter ruber]|uniref:hypothetical protein n=1 Tax=Salinibacter ruber TaxID=146919 RepID=UPI00216A588D|nr:hypothetical protein [Salinibacter ruber]MCS3684280.1 hypothetical protein [Salinibacter ruber]
MSNESKGDNRTGSRGWGDRVVDGAIGALFTLASGLALFYFTSESPDLSYEVFPPSSFVSEQTERTIYTVRIANQGDAKAEEVRAVFDFSDGATVQDSKVNTSSKAITYNLVDTSTSTMREYTFPLLNPGENAKFSFLLSGNPQRVNVDLRGEGVVGAEVDRTTQRGISWMIWLIGGLGGVILLLLFQLGKLSIRNRRAVELAEDATEVAENAKNQADVAQGAAERLRKVAESATDVAEKAMDEDKSD